MYQYVHLEMLLREKDWPDQSVGFPLKNFFHKKNQQKSLQKVSL